MAAPLLRPRWIVGHLLALTAVVSFIALGMWQLRRHDEKSELRAAVATAQELPPVPMESVGDGEFRRVSVSGEYLGPTTLVLRSQSGESGYLVLSILRSSGDAVLVSRGWVPLDGRESLDLSPPAGIVKVAGTLWPAEEGSAMPDSIEPVEGVPAVVNRIDPEIPTMLTGMEVRGEYLILSESSPPEALLAPEPPGVSLGPHLGYAMQWLAFTLIVLVGYPLLLRRTLRGSASLAGEDADGDDGDAEPLDDAGSLA